MSITVITVEDLSKGNISLGKIPYVLRWPLRFVHLDLAFIRGLAFTLGLVAATRGSTVAHSVRTYTQLPT